MYFTQAQPSAFSSPSQETKHQSDSFSSSRAFSRSLNEIWDVVEEAKKNDIAKTKDDIFWHAYRKAEDLLREACEDLSKVHMENAQLKAKLAQLEKPSL